jgi:hypothetical protein
MKKSILVVSIVALIGLAACDSTPPSGNITPSIAPSSIASSELVSVQTPIRYDQDNIGTEFPTTTFPVNKYVYLRITMNANNPANVTRNVSATITIPNSEKVTFQPEGSTTGALPVCNPTSLVDGGRRTTCTGIDFTLEASESFTRTYVFRLLGFIEGDYRLQVAYNNSVKVNDRIVERSFNFKGYLPVHPTPVISLEDDRITWTNSQASIIKYEISIDDEIISSDYNFNYYSLTDFDADVSYKFSVRTLSDFYEYSTSNQSDFLFQKLNAPEISILNGVISWEAVFQADKYIVQVGSTTIEVTDTEYEVNFGNAGVQDISVAASSSFVNVARSNFSSPLTVSKLEAPVLRDDLLQVVWDEVEGAVSYDIYVNDTLIENTTNLFHDKIPSLNASVYVVAKSNLNHVIASNQSNIITYLIG